MSLAFIIQARLGSTRFPQKIIRPFWNNLSIIELLFKKISLITDNIILATSVSPENDALENIASKYNIKTYRGSEEDVLQRFIGAAESYNIDKVIRVCSDNPFIDIKDLHTLYCEAQKSTSAEYVGFKIDGKPSIKTHYGFWCEYVTLNALKRAASLTSLPLFHEHVTNYIYSHPELFHVEWLIPSFNPIQGLRLTVDTPEDFAVCKEIFGDLRLSDGELPQTNAVLNLLNNNKDYLERMDKEITLNSK